MSGRVSESLNCFQLGTQFRYTSKEHSTPVQDTQSTHIEHHQQDSTCTTSITGNRDGLWKRTQENTWSIKQLKNHTIVRIVEMMGGGGKKGQKKQNKEETTSSSEIDALQEMLINLMKQDDEEGNSIFQAMTQLDDEPMKDHEQYETSL